MDNSLVRYSCRSLKPSLNGEITRPKVMVRIIRDSQVITTPIKLTLVPVKRSLVNDSYITRCGNIMTDVAVITDCSVLTGKQNSVVSSS